MGHVSKFIILYVALEDTILHCTLHNSLEQYIGIIAANMPALIPLGLLLHDTACTAFSRTRDVIPSISHRVISSYTSPFESLNGSPPRFRARSGTLPIIPRQNLAAARSKEWFVFERDDSDVERTDERLRWLRDDGYRPVGV